MTALSTAPVNYILNQVAVEVGLESSTDPFASQEQHFKQLRRLLQVAGDELDLAHPWEMLTRDHQFITTAGTEGYDVPSDYLYMLPQTGWEYSNNRPLSGPLTPQDWTYIKSDGNNPIIHAFFRLKGGKFMVLEAPNNFDVRYEYQSRCWIAKAGDVNDCIQDIDSGADVPLYDRTLVARYLKLKWLEAKGFDTAKAQNDFNQIFDFMTGKDKNAPILHAGRTRSGARLLNWVNIPDTGYGSF